MNDSQFEVLIVGGGPAGAFAAERLARGGARVALFDGRPSNEPKACGGGVTSKALRMWPYLLEAGGHTVSEIDMHSPKGTRVRLKLKEPFIIYSRSALDSYLLERARNAGVIVHQACVKADIDSTSDTHEWTVRTREGQTWRGRVLVAADGANSPIARRLAGALPKEEMEVAFGYRAPLSQSDVEARTVIAFLPGWAGYAWAFPRLDHISFGIATAQNTFDHQRLDQLLWNFMVNYYGKAGRTNTSLWTRAEDTHGGQSDADVEEGLRASVEKYAARIPGLAPETWKRRRACGKDWALLGDAAGFADPITGEGIYYALRSAELFAEAYLDGSLESYEESWRADFGRELWRAARMRRRFYGQFGGAPFTEQMVRLGRIHAGIRRTLSELVAGDQGYLDLKHTLMRRFLWPVS
ncbi:MAG: NAD(P)/FAD-dependent oxidoreductase [Pyrinomonadaceae bacterium]